MSDFINRKALIDSMDRLYNEKVDIVPNNLAEGFHQMEKLIKEQPSAFYSEDLNSYIIKLNFLWDDGVDTQSFRIRVPKETSLDEIHAKILETHDLLDTGEEEYYEKNGRNPESLMSYISDETGWNIKELEYALDIELD